MNGNERSLVDYLHLCGFAYTCDNLYMHLLLDNREVYGVNKMDDLISRQAALDALNGGFTVTGRENAETIMDFLNGVCKKLRDLPSAERSGRWIFNIDDQGWSWDYPYMCDQCGEWAEKEFKFCPNCGARMEATE